MFIEKKCRVVNGEIMIDLATPIQAVAYLQDSGHWMFDKTCTPVESTSKQWKWVQFSKAPIEIVLTKI